MFTSLLKITSFYKDFLTGYYLSNPQITGKSFYEQYKHLMDQGYGYSDYFPRYLRKNHKIRSFEYVHNAAPLQQAWARENSASSMGDDLLLEQIAQFQPEVLFFQDSSSFHGAFFERVRKKVNSVNLLVGHICSPYTAANMEAFRHFDLMLTCSEKFREELTQHGIRAYLFPHAFESTLAPKPEPNRIPDNDIIFIGSLLYRSEFHHERIAYMEEILGNGLPLTMYGMIENDPWHILKLKQAAYLGLKGAERLGMKGHLKNPRLRKITQLNEIPVRAPYSRAIKQGIIKDQLYGKNMLKEISNHAISFNMHARVAGEYAANVRMYEVTGAGSLLVSDHKRNIPELFEPGEEILTYRSKEECIEKLRWALDNPEKAAEIAARGQKRTLNDHSVEKRVELLLEILEMELKKID
jgi:hypothetical protein